MKKIILIAILIAYNNLWSNTNQDTVLNHLVDIEQRISYLEEENSRLINIIEEIINKIDKIPLKDTTTQQETSSIQITPNIEESIDDKETLMYNNTISLISSGDFTTAKNNLIDFISIYPKSIFTPEVYYWIGEINFANQLYKDAAINYLNSYKKSPHGNRSIESVFKLALSLKHTENPIGACHTLKNILTDFGTIPFYLKEKIYKELEEL